MTHRRQKTVVASMGGIADAATDKVKRHIDPRRSAKQPGRINLRAVSEVLAARGLDPTEEIVKLLLPREGADGKPVIDLDPDVRARMWNELLQYTQPKLKSVEVKAKGSLAVFDVTDDQARKMAQEFLRAGMEAASE